MASKNARPPAPHRRTSLHPDNPPSQSRSPRHGAQVIVDELEEWRYRAGDVGLVISVLRDAGDDEALQAVLNAFMWAAGFDSPKAQPPAEPAQESIQ